MDIVEKAIRIDDYLESFLNDHPEIQIKEDKICNVFYITIPDDYTLIFLLISPINNFLHLIYADANGEIIKFPANL